MGLTVSMVVHNSMHYLYDHLKVCKTSSADKTPPTLLDVDDQQNEDVGKLSEIFNKIAT